MREHPNLTEGHLSKQVFSLALPMMLGTFMQNLFNLVDMFFVGKIGASALAAVSISGVIFGFIIMVALGIGMGTTAMVARAIGAKNHSLAKIATAQVFFFSIAAWVLVGISGYFLASPLLSILGASQDVVVQGVPYIKIMSLGSGLIFLFVGLSAAFRGAGDPIVSVRAMVAALLLNIVLDPIMIFGLLGTPRMGVAGSALATVISRLIAAAILFYVIIKQHRIIQFGIKDIKLDISVMWRTFKIGIYSSIQSLIRNISSIILVRIVTGFGTAAVAAYGIGMRLQMVAMMPGFGFGNAAATMVGQNLGARKPDRASRSGWFALSQYEGIMAFVSIVYIIFAAEIIKIFNTDAAVVDMGSHYLRYVGSTMLFLGATVVLSRALGGAGDTRTPTIVMVISFLIVRLGAAYLLAKPYGISGVWIGIALSNLVSGIIMSATFLWGNWREKRI